MTLKDALKQKGWTVQHLADETGISKRTLDKYMTGERDLRRAEAANIIKIADVLGIHPRELMN
ncbi:MAG: helix-turn-helix transcriptional regulator [Phoenicibacter congonensis]|uniref:Helix-turn-helix transcriptional regulator n=1 Tax=Phoenicibacter congonensis TaxID=1944646 RepID=A0AA43RMV3_9ACTN|nr:helix-turn-helix transcriptional regulator [Phoenicibacter congonensis]